MEILSTSTVFTLLAIALITIILSKFFAAIYRQQTYWKNNNVPYIESVPLLGPAWRFLLRRISFVDYGVFVYNYHPNAKYVGTMDFTLPNLIVRDPELIREIAVKSFEHFTDHRSFMDENVEPVFAKNLFSLRGKRWKEMRNILTPSFTASKMRFMFELISKCSEQFVDYLYDHPEYSSSLEMKDAFTRYTSDVIATVAFGVNVNSMKDRDNEFFVHGKGAFASIFGSISKLLLMRLCPGAFKVLGISIIPRSTTNFFRNIISESVKVREEQGIVRPDMLHLLIQARDKEKSTTNQMTIDDIVSQAFLFFLGGSESSSNFLCYICYELALNQDIQENLRKEIDRYLEETNGEISYETLLNMEYMEMVMSETLRKYPLTIFNDRVCTKQFEFPPAAPGYSSVVLYPGEVVWFPMYSLHHDPKYFPDPERFDPERFNEENKEKIVPYTYFPFGVGPRKCIADRFALMEAKILIVHLLRRFVIKPTEKTQIPIVFKKNSFTPAPATGLWIGLEKRAS